MTDSIIGRKITGSFTKRHNLNVAFITDSGTTDIPESSYDGGWTPSTKYFDISAGVEFYNCPIVAEGEDLDLEFRLSEKATISIFYTAAIKSYNNIELGAYITSNIVLDGSEIEPPLSRQSMSSEKVDTIYFIETLDAGIHNVKIVGHIFFDLLFGGYIKYPRLTVISDKLINE